MDKSAPNIVSVSYISDTGEIQLVFRDHSYRRMRIYAAIPYSKKWTPCTCVNGYMSFASSEPVVSNTIGYLSSIPVDIIVKIHMFDKTTNAISESFTYTVSAIPSTSLRIASGTNLSRCCDYIRYGDDGYGITINALLYCPECNFDLDRSGRPLRIPYMDL